MIVGGAGGIGVEIGRYLAKKVQARIVLVGRSKYNKVIESKIKRLEEEGGRAIYISADITDPRQIKSAIKRAGKEYGRINGFIHAVGHVKAKLITNINENEFKQAIEAKTKGSFVLHQAFKGTALDFSVFFSSVNSQLGLPGASSYVSGCNFQDNFCHYANTLSNNYRHCNNKKLIESQEIINGSC